MKFSDIRTEHKFNDHITPLVTGLSRCKIDSFRSRKDLGVMLKSCLCLKYLAVNLKDLVVRWKGCYHLTAIPHHPHSPIHGKKSAACYGKFNEDALRHILNLTT
ncbi:MAG: hypothetical protein ACJAYB_001094 [Psychromonas sp.]|jgi:hypothetical protein